MRKLNNVVTLRLNEAYMLLRAKQRATDRFGYFYGRGTLQVSETR